MSNPADGIWEMCQDHPLALPCGPLVSEWKTTALAGVPRGQHHELCLRVFPCYRPTSAPLPFCRKGARGAGYR